MLEEMPVLFYRQLVELAAIPIGRLTSRRAFERRLPETARVKSLERSATDELR